MTAVYLLLYVCAHVSEFSSKHCQVGRAYFSKAKSPKKFSVSGSLLRLLFFFFAFSSCVSVFHCVRFVTSSSSFSPLPVFIVVVDCVCVCTQLCRRGTHGGKILFC